MHLGYNDGNYCDVINIDNQGYLGFGHEFRAPQTSITLLQSRICIVASYACITQAGSSKVSGLRSKLCYNPGSALLLFFHLIHRLFSLFSPYSCIRRLTPPDCTPGSFTSGLVWVQEVGRVSRMQEGQKKRRVWDIYCSPFFPASPCFWWWLCSSVAQLLLGGPFLLLPSSGSSDMHFLLSLLQLRAVASPSAWSSLLVLLVPPTPP